MRESTYHHGNLKQALIKNGAKLLIEEGYDRFSLRKVARLSRVSHTAPYRHFKNKDQLIILIVNKAYRDFYNTLYGAIKMYPDNPVLQLKEIGKRFILFSIENADFMRILFFSKAKTKFEEYVKSGKIYELVINRIALCKKMDLIKADDIETTATMLWSFVLGFSSLIIEGNIKPEGNIEDFTEKILNELTKLVKK